MFDYCIKCGTEHSFMSMQPCEACGNNTFRRLPPEEEQCFVVQGTCGAYSDRCDWDVRVFPTEEEAKAFCDHLLTPEGQRRHDPFWHGGDPAEDVCYSIEEVPLGVPQALEPVVVRDILLEDMKRMALRALLRREVQGFHTVQTGWPNRKTNLFNITFVMDAPERKPKRNRKPVEHAMLYTDYQERFRTVGDLIDWLVAESTV